MDTGAGREGKERTPHVRIRFSIGLENERSDAGQDSQNCLVSLKSQARTGSREMHYYSCSAHHCKDW